MTYPKRLERALIVGAYFTRMGGYQSQQSRRICQDSMDELALLADSAGAEVVKRKIQERPKPDPATFIGKGMVEQIAREVKDESIDIVIFDDDLSPGQNRNLEQKLDCKVIDRSGLILDIFARRARTKEGKLQVELAQMEYLYPRLVGRWMHFSRQEGGIGMRGPGETQLEVDRRLVKERIAKLTQKIEKIKVGREIRSEKRKNSILPIISLVGYTNAGKSTLLNALSGSSEYADDRLFATLDPVTRRVSLNEHFDVLMNDTVGFVRKLPHQLIASFRATFEEITQSDLLLHVVDMHHRQSREQVEVVFKVLKEHEAEKIPLIMVYNKCDLSEKKHVHSDEAYDVSALNGDGIDSLKQAIERKLESLWPRITLKLPLKDGKLRAQVFELGTVLSEKLIDNALHIEVRLPQKLANRYQDYFLT